MGLHSFILYLRSTDPWDKEPCEPPPMPTTVYVNWYKIGEVLSVVMILLLCVETVMRLVKHA